MVDATKLADLAHLFRRIGTRVTVLPVKSNASMSSVRHSSTRYQWEQMFVGANGNDDGGKRKQRPEQKTEGVEGGEPQQKMPRLAPLDQETEEMVADWMTQLEGMPPEIQMLILQFVLRPRFMPTYRRVGERWERVDLELRQNHAIMETRRLMRAYLALRQTSRYWRSLLLDTSLRIAMYLDWVRSPVMPLWLDTSVPDDKGIYKGYGLEELYVRRIQETMPELHADVPSTPAWYSTYLANLILHQFMQEQHRDGIKYQYGNLVDKSQLRSPHTIYAGSERVVYWDGRLRDEEIIEAYEATPRSGRLWKRDNWTLRELYSGEAVVVGTTPGGDTIYEGRWTITLPGFSYRDAVIMRGPGKQKEDLVSWWTQIPVTESPVPPNSLHRRYVSFIHYSFIASSVVRIPTCVFPAIKGATVGWKPNYGFPTMAVDLHFRRTLFLDYPIPVYESGMAPLAPSVVSSFLVRGKYVVSMTRPRPYRRIVLKNVRIGSVSQLGWKLSYMAYSMGDAGYWFDIFATTSKTQEDQLMRLYVTKDTYTMVRDEDERMFHSLSINRDMTPTRKQPLYEFETLLPTNRWILVVGASSANDPELMRLPKNFWHLYKAYQPLAPQGNPLYLGYRANELWLDVKWEKPQDLRVPVVFMSKIYRYGAVPQGVVTYSKEGREEQERLLATWHQENEKAVKEYRKQREQDE